jgi:ATP/maltotriose-dependent transcriptional regulator MalT
VEALATSEEMPPEDGSARALGIYLATLAIVLAANGDADAARKMAASARNYGSNIEMRYCAQLGEVIAEKVDGRQAGLRKRIQRLVAECGRAEYLDGLVFAFRVHPPLLEDAKGSPETLSITRRALTLSCDHELARHAGVRLQTADMDAPLGSLTPREVEVLGLLTQGLTNEEIARSLYITKATAKVHVRHIFEKLGVRNRIQAILLAQELLEGDLN